MRALLLLFCLALGACTAGGPGFAGRPAMWLSEGGSDFVVRRNGAVAEAIRTDFDPLPRWPLVSDRAARAVEDWTGCTAAWATGDVTLLRIGLSCGGAPAPPRPAPPLLLDCAVLAETEDADGDPAELSLDCVSL